MPKSRTEMALEAVAVVGLLLGIVLVVRTWSSITGPVPRHFDIAGKPDAYGGRVWLAATPALSLLLYLGLTYVQAIPHRYNYPWTITAKNAAAHYQLARTLITALKVVVVWVFAYLAWEQVQTGLGQRAALGVGFLPFTLLALVAVFCMYFLRARRVGR